MIVGVLFGLIFSGFEGVLISVIMAFGRFKDDVTWANNYFTNSYNYESIVWNILLVISILFNLLTICLVHYLVSDRKPN